MTLFTLVLIAVVILAVIGLGWNTFIIYVDASSGLEDLEKLVKDKMAKDNDQIEQMAKEAYTNGSCLNSTDIMSIFTHPDTETAFLGTKIPEC